VPFGPVGRAVLAPPPDLVSRGAVLALIDETISLFGTSLTFQGIPFSQQDGEFIRCAHAAAWICHYSAYRRGLAARHLTARVVDYSPPHLSSDRPLPSTGMNYHQMQAVFGRMGQPALIYALGSLPTVQGVTDPKPDPNKQPGQWDTRLFSVICRYLNSGFPVLIGTTEHAFVLIGYYEEMISGTKWIRFIACDDQVGPYEVIADPTSDGSRGPWEALMVPLPAKVFLTAESAENDAYETLYGLQFATAAPQTWIDLGKSVATGNISLRTMLVRGTDFKREVASQGRAADVVRELRLARLSNWVWIVEAHDRAARSKGDPCVLAEFVYDSTSFDLSPTRLAVSYPDVTVTIPPDKGTPSAIAGTPGAWKSQFAV
jgi:hypothetical protein